MKIYLLSNKDQEDVKAEYTFVNTSEKNFIEKILEINNDNIILTDINIPNILLFDMKKDNFENNELNKIILDKNLKVIKINKFTTDSDIKFNIIDIIYFIVNHTKKFKFTNRKNEEKLLQNKLKKIKNCIIVGNGQNQKNGEFVDSKDFVIRINNAVVKNMKHLVGNKTNMYFSGSELVQPDFEGIDFTSKKIVKIISKGVLNLPPGHWLYVHSTLPKTYNFSEICPKLGFWFKECVESTNKIIEKHEEYFNYIEGTTGVQCQHIMIYNSLILGYKIFITGFDCYSKLQYDLEHEDLADNEAIIRYYWEEKTRGKLYFKIDKSRYITGKDSMVYQRPILDLLLVNNILYN